MSTTTPLPLSDQSALVTGAAPGLDSSANRKLSSFPINSSILSEVTRRDELGV